MWEWHLLKWRHVTLSVEKVSVNWDTSAHAVVGIMTECCAENKCDSVGDLESLRKNMMSQNSWFWGLAVNRIQRR